MQRKRGQVGLVLNEPLDAETKLLAVLTSIVASAYEQIVGHATPFRSREELLGIVVIDKAKEESHATTRWMRQTSQHAVR